MEPSSRKDCGLLLCGHNQLHGFYLPTGFYIRTIASQPRNNTDHTPSPLPKTACPANKESDGQEKGGILLEEWKLVIREAGFTLNGKSNPIRNFSIKELEQATNNYNSSLVFDRWMYSEWYKGSLEGRFVSVRKFHPVIDDAFLERVIKEITFATQLGAHKNVLKLLGCCLETQTPVLVYEYPVNGVVPLYDVIHPSADGKSRQRLPWKSRLRISGDIAHVIAYLHTAFPRAIIHREVTLSFFFLDEDCVPKLSNFFFAIALPEGRKYVVDAVMGIEGFIAPEYEMTGMVTEKVDVFSFGKLLLELLTGRDFGPLGNDGELSLDCIKTYVEDHELDGFVDASILPRGGEIHDQHQFLAVIKLALRCIMTAAEQRPTMVEIAKELRRIQRGICSNMTLTPTSSISPTDSMIQMANPLNQLIDVKLDVTNYPIWKRQVQTAIRGYGLEGFILGTREVPPELIQVEDGTQMVNPAYISYQQQDHLLASWILASMSPSFLPQLVGSDTALDIWNTVGHIFTSQSTAKIMHYKHQLQILKKGSLPMVYSTKEAEILQT
ncbi:non-functional pseudokinase ZED1-like [Vitis riparia]|uniref:non-functional pseudokinase ZED1-like n=1 Tax=Vitis riparia TaxID=96939 RepID=UPI00155A1B51|nr:non-functional pseudokinase ZED1-like [Vitis riparia]